MALAPSPVVALNQAVAVADGPAAGLALVGELEATSSLGQYDLLPATKTDLFRRLGRHEDAAAS